jgi:hypothetical protein
LDKALGHDSLVVSICVIQIVECVANTGIAKLRLATPALGLIKMSILVQYFYLFGVIRYVRVSV